MTENLTRALKAAGFLESQIGLWHKYLPNAFGQAHWHIITYVRPYGYDGLPLKRVFYHVASIFGMDSTTCNRRLKDLFAEGLLVANENNLKRGTLISPTARLIERYDAYNVELANLMISITLNDPSSAIVNGNGGPSLNDRIASLYDRLGKIGEPRIAQFLVESVRSPALREKVLHCLQTYTYWCIVSMAWRNRAEDGEFLISDDFHMKIYPITKKGSNATRNSLQDLIDWGFLRRLNQTHGVRSNRFAVCMTDSAFDLYSSLFSLFYDVLEITGQDIASRFAYSSAEGNTVIPMVRSIRNVS